MQLNLRRLGVTWLPHSARVVGQCLVFPALRVPLPLVVLGVGSFPTQSSAILPVPTHPHCAWRGDALPPDLPMLSFSHHTCYLHLEQLLNTITEAHFLVCCLK